jgi:hypothetical protein
MSENHLSICRSDKVRELPGLIKYLAGRIC